MKSHLLTALCQPAVMYCGLTGDLHTVNLSKRLKPADSKPPLHDVALVMPTNVSVLSCGTVAEVLMSLLRAVHFECYSHAFHWYELTDAGSLFEMWQNNF